MSEHANRDAPDRAPAEMDRRVRDLQNRLVTFVSASSTLFGSPKLDDVMEGILTLADALVPADGYAIWRLDSAAAVWQIGASRGISDRFAQRIIHSLSEGPASTLTSNEPIVAEDIAAVPRFRECLEAYRDEGVQSILAVPLQIAGRGTGSLVFYYRERHRFDELDVQAAQALGTLSAAAVTTAELYDAQRRSRESAEHHNRRAEFLAQASAALASSLDYEATLRMVAQLAVPHIADWCAVDVLDDRDELQRVAVAHVDPRKVELARTLQERYPENPKVPNSVRTAMRSGQPLLVADVPEDDDHQSGAEPGAPRGHPRPVDHLVYLRAAQRARPHAGRDHVRERGVEAALHGRRSPLRPGRRVPLSARGGQRARVLARQRGEPREGRVPRDAVARAADAAQRRARLDADAAIGRRSARQGAAGARSDRAERERAGAARRRSARPVAHHHGQVPARRPDDAALLVGRGGRRGDSTGGHGQEHRRRRRLRRRPGAGVRRSAAAAAGGVEPAVERRQVHAERRPGERGAAQRAGTHRGADRRHRRGHRADVLPFVFDRFRQADSGTTRSHMGLGLGLAIVRHIIELHGGRVGVTSAGPGCGATFRLALPLLVPTPGRVPPPPRPAAEAQASSFGNADAAGRAIAGLRVLVVDDDPDTVHLLAELLGQRGVDVRTSESVDQALAELARDTPDLIITDIAMPGRDGYDLLKEVRAHVASRVPVLAVSAYARVEDRARSAHSGFAAHVAKPLDVDELFVAMAEATGRTPRSHE